MALSCSPARRPASCPSTARDGRHSGRRPALLRERPHTPRNSVSYGQRLTGSVRRATRVFGAPVQISVLDGGHSSSYPCRLGSQGRNASTRVHLPNSSRHHAGTNAAGMRSRTGRYECRHHGRPTVVAGVNNRWSVLFFQVTVVSTNASTHPKCSVSHNHTGCVGCLSVPWCPVIRPDRRRCPLGGA
jgi:hypothetical protein